MSDRLDDIISDLKTLGISGLKTTDGKDITVDRLKEITDKIITPETKTKLPNDLAQGEIFLTVWIESGKEFSSEMVFYGKSEDGSWFKTYINGANKWFRTSAFKELHKIIKK